MTNAGTLRGAASYTVAPSGYRLPSALRLGHVTLQVADLDRSIAYYDAVVGLRAGTREDGRVVLRAADGKNLVELREHAGATPVPPRGRLGLFHFAILVPDRPTLGSFVRHLRDNAVPFARSDHLVSEAIYLSDPDGLGIEVYADRPRSEWTASDGSIRMDTLPLNVSSLLEASRDREWEGMPAGTRIGHVHLHVGDLTTAAEFYHEGLGFERLVLDMPGAMFMSAGGYHHHLGTNTWAVGAAAPREVDARLIEWRIELPTSADVDEVASAVERQGIAVTREDESVTVTDPWGTPVRIAIERDGLRDA
jgi:catechol 2,3-dioxygenase